MSTSNPPREARPLRLQIQAPKTSTKRKRQSEAAMNSGFPHERDSWISAAASSRAVMALRQHLDAAVTVAGAILGDRFDQNP